ncbi:protein YgfX [Atopomonas sediminilitoris]|uniref:protein YgfX n=1 Tax=Atopomonas sediminilitoris TaxID=2919919 RepID=UPI001F4EF189|nr:protein YgfX [Atopomonas sediminilitoris]MCJ8168601.1 hypothetical protein [Atopomonas sediminilitoris]
MPLWQRRAYLALFAVTLALLLYVPWPWYWRAAGVLLCVAHAAWCLPPMFSPAKQRWQSVRHDAQGWAVCDAQGQWQPLTLIAGTRVWRRLVVLRFTLAGERWPHSLCLTPDMLAPACHRRLRVRLRFSGRGQDTAADTE